MKTNKRWYPYDDFGLYYTLQNGVLMASPMLQNGTRSLSEEEEFEVDFGLLEGDTFIKDEEEMLITDRLNEIKEDLEDKY